MGGMREIGSNLTQHRERVGLTLSSLSERSGVAKSTISMLENGGGNPTVETMWALASALGVSFGSLVEQGGPQKWRELNSAEANVRFIERSAGDPEIEVYMIELRSAGRHTSNPHPDGVKESITILSGAMLVGDVARPRLLHKGDSYTFEANIPHEYRALDGDAKALICIEYPSASCTTTSSTSWLDWPQASVQWDGVRSAVERAMIEVANGVGVRLLRFRGGKQDQYTLRKHLGFDGCWRWPVLRTIDADTQGCYVAVVGLLATSAFPARSLKPQHFDLPGLAFAAKLARLAESGLCPIEHLDALTTQIPGESWVLNSLVAEVLLQRNRVILPKQLKRAGGAGPRDFPAPDGSFSSRIHVDHYDAFELLHPAYARQVVALAEDLAEFVELPLGGPVIDVGSGPGIPLLMLHELHPQLQLTAIEPDPIAYACLIENTQHIEAISPRQIGFLELELSPASVSVITSVGASHHFNTAFMLQQAARLLQPNGVLIVADEFLPPFADGDERNLALVCHHTAYVLASMAWIGDRNWNEDGRDAKLYQRLRRDLVMAYLAACDGKTAQAMKLCRDLEARMRSEGLDKAPEESIGYFVRFYVLELQAMVAGFDYEVEQKTYPQRFLELAQLAGFELLRHRRVFATQGGDRWGGGTHVFSLRRRDFQL